MKSKMLLALASLLIVSMVVTSPVSAQGVTYQAFGTLDEYNPDIPELNRARLVGGIWRINIKDDAVNFRSFHVELNVEEQIPGTYDVFRLVLTEVTDVTIDDSHCEIEGTLVLYKIGFEPYTGEFGFWTIELDGATITIDPSGIWIYWPPWEPWAIGGSTLFIR